MKAWRLAERPRLVLLCGIGEDEAMWRPVMNAVADAADCLPMVAKGDSVAAMAADILARTSGSVAVAGHSLGGYVALAMQRAAPDRVTRLALLNTSAQPDDLAAQGKRRQLIERIAMEGFASVVRRLAPVLSARPVSDAEAMLLRCGETRFVREQRAAAARPDARAGLQGIDVPLLVIGGAKDAVVAPERSVEMAEAVPGSTLIMLPDTGHLAPVEAPEAVAVALRAWLAAPSIAVQVAR